MDGEFLGHVATVWHCSCWQEVLEVKASPRLRTQRMETRKARRWCSSVAYQERLVAPALLACALDKGQSPTISCRFATVGSAVEALHDPCLLTSHSRHRSGVKVSSRKCLWNFFRVWFHALRVILPVIEPSIMIPAFMPDSWGIIPILPQFSSASP